LKNSQTKSKETHAIVIGGGFGGLLAGKALSKHYEKVTIIERDAEPAPGSLAPRGGAPQGPHVHFLLPQGLIAIQRLLPKFIDAITARGANVLNLYQDMRISDLTNFKIRVKTSRNILLMSRLLIEATIRTLVAENTNIVFKYYCNAMGLLANFKENRITGVRLQDLTKKEEVNLYADLVVDASGASTCFPDWLEALGFDKPIITRVPMDYIQVSRWVRLPKEYQPDWKYTAYRDLTLRKGGYALRLEDDHEGAQWLFGFVSHFGEPITSSEKGFLEFAKKILEPELFNLLKKSKPITPIKQCSVPNIRKYSYSTNKRLPTNFFAVGDAMCLWPPHTALGLATAARAAVSLDNYLANKNISKAVNRNRIFFNITEKSINKNWDKRINKEVIPLIHPKNSIFLKFLAWYKRALSDLCTTNARASKAELDISFFPAKPFYTLFHPAIFFKVMWNKLKGK